MEIAKMRDSMEIDGQNARSRIQLLPERLTAVLPRDGFLTFLLTFAIIYITVVSIQTVQPVWADGLQILTPAMLFGVAVGYIAMQQTLIRGNLMHLLALLSGCAISFFLTSNAVLNGNRALLLSKISIWLQRSLLNQQVSTDNSVFVLFLTLLTFLLAYLTIWLVFIARRPWLALVANAVVLLININQSTSDQFYFLVIFLVVTLLLLVRFALAENVRQWRHIGLRFSPDLSWDFMQAGAIFAVIVALIPNLLPFAQPNQTLLSYLTSDQSPIIQAQQRFENLFSGANGRGSGSYGFFDSNLQLVGSVNLPDTPILRYTLPINSQSDATQYLITEAFSTYDGIKYWQRPQSIEQGYTANQAQPPSTNVYQLDTYRITFLTTPSGGQRYIFAPGSDAATFSIPSASLVSVGTHEPITWLSQSPLPAGSTYTATGYVSNATVSQLQSVPYPANASSSDSNHYPPDILAEYLPQNEPLDPLIISTAKQVTQGAKNMYDAATDIERYLHQNFTYNAHNPDPPANEDATVWFLQRREGFCTFFASAMALMGRALGMPTRVVSGYASGVYDEKTNSFIVRGTQAHTWTQVYFAQYGWINFEPTAEFSPFARPIPNGQNVGPQGPSQTPVATPNDAQHGRTTLGGSSTPDSATKGVQGFARVAMDLGILALIVLLIAGVIALWWRSLFKNYSPVARGFARLVMLGIWAGISPKRSQTPREYASQLATAAPVQREAIERLGALYARERWGNALTPAEVTTIERLYEQGRGALLSIIAHRIKQAPAQLLRRGVRLPQSMSGPASRT
jgi:transglutaminase-like putative cysteine protease